MLYMERLFRRTPSKNPLTSLVPPASHAQAYGVATRRGWRDRIRARSSRDRRQRSRRICERMWKGSTGGGCGRGLKLAARHEPAMRRGFGSDRQA